MNIYYVQINDLPGWLTEAENIPTALQTVANEIVNAPGDTDHIDLVESLALLASIILVATHTTLVEFEQNHPPQYDEYF